MPSIAARAPTIVKISLAPRPYEAVIQHGILRQAGARFAELYGEQRPAFVVTTPPVRRRWGKWLAESFATARLSVKFVEMPDGERYKKLATVEDLAEKLIHAGADRNAVVIAFGGGVVGDSAGLLASLYMRGVEFLQIPTTVLAQVDASIGGKTGVNLRSGKNLVGTFNQPRAVWIDPGVLSTLPDREFQAGLYESLKCGVIGNPELFALLQKMRPRELRKDHAKLEWVIAESVRLKAELVSADERESNVRRFLNFGHTIGHALESLTEYRHFLHGEAVAWGMIAASDIAASLKYFSSADADRVAAAVQAMGPLPAVNVRSRDVLRILQTDKKTSYGVVHFVLPREIGRVEVVKDVPERVVIEAVDGLRRMSAQD
ncbi:MAG: 3-dehydroquinate synthase [Acidobacteriaceae bacterium]|jgi:3-dehydroquinate synthase